MTRKITVGAAQFGPVHRTETRQAVVKRLVALLREGHARGCDLVVFTEVALTAFFPHWHMTDEAEIDAYFEREMPSPVTQPLFDEAARLQVGFHLGHAELVWEQGEKRHYNTAILVNKHGQVLGKYRKIHLPGYDCYQPGQPFQNLEKLYFDVGNLGFRTWNAFGGVMGICICNDRRWPETYRTLALQGAEMVVLGYNTPLHNPALPASDPLANFHNHLCMQAGAYQNALWVVGAAKAGLEEGVMQIGQSCIIAPTGEIVAMASTLEDELVVARCDLDLAQLYRKKLWNFARNRRVEHYGLITQQLTPSADDAD
ncbi:MAG: N-carbamoyl-D-amino-acid hydrolase [Chloroflexi bacterium]|nr:MAG: N-carbamoyl-D-amino-acid hydrolase [Chloroflexota bacterium]